MTDSTEVKPFPTHSGTMRGYIIEIQIKGGDEWKKIETRQNETGHGAPHPQFAEPLKMLDLLGYAQAMSLAWGLRAEPDFPRYARVRVVPHKVEYSTKAWRDEGGAVEVGCGD